VSIPDPYKILQVDSEAEEEVIEAAYRRLARKYHPDVASGSDAQERMVRINQAWEVLRDPVRRAAVDRARLRAGTQTARVAAADAQARTAGSDAPRYSPGPAYRRQAYTPPPAAPGQPAAWPIPGMRDPYEEAAAGPRTEAVSRDMSGGRSTSGSSYDPSTMRRPDQEAAAGPPPGNPAGSVLNFGRFAGWSLGEIARVELEYLEWLDRMPIGRIYQPEIDALLRRAGRRTSAAPEQTEHRGLFRRR
jgi:curved DNA-binding protein CbpA